MGDSLSRNDDASDLFNKAMANFTEQETDSILSAYDFSDFTKVADIGGGSGALICAVLKRYPQIKGILFDLPFAVEKARELLKDKVDENNYALIDGDFFKSVPAGGKLYTLKSVIHDWDNEHAITILKNCHDG